MSTNQQSQIKTDSTHPPGWLTIEEGKFLCDLASQAKIPHILEIGSLFGRSASFILEGMRKKFGNTKHWLWCVEPWSHFNPELVTRFGYPPLVFWNYMIEHEYYKNLRVLQCTSQDAIPQIKQRQYDFVFIDGVHRLPELAIDLVTASMVTNRILLHDYSNSIKFRVKMLVDFWIKETSWRIDELVVQTVVIHKK